MNQVKKLTIQQQRIQNTTPTLKLNYAGAQVNSYAIQSKTFNIPETKNHTKLPSMPFKDYKKMRNVGRASLNTVPVAFDDPHQKSLFTGESNQKFRVVVLPPFAKTGKGPAELKSKAFWNKIQQSYIAETQKQPKKSSQMISHQKSQSALNFNEKIGSVDLETIQHEEFEQQKMKFYLRTEYKPQLTTVKPCGFLASVGGKQTTGAKFSLPTNFILREEMQKAEHAHQIAIFTGLNVDQKRKDQLVGKLPTESIFFLDKDSSRQREDRQTRTLKSNYIRDTADELPITTKSLLAATQEFKNSAVKEPQRNFKSRQDDDQKLVSGDQQSKLIQSEQQKSKNYTKTVNLTHTRFKQGADNSDEQIQDRFQLTGKFSKPIRDEFPYPELFDRAERTLAATFAKVGDLNYFTPSQRIGCFMEYTLRLKRKHLMDLIAYIKVAKISLRVDDDEKNDKSDFEYLEQSLFLGLMINEEVTDKKLSVYQVGTMPEIVTKFSKSLHNQVKAYDPSSSQLKLGLQVEKVWSTVLVAKLELSMKRFMHYIESPDMIKSIEISQYRKFWMSNALQLVPDRFLSDHPGLVRTIFEEIFSDYQVANKVAIMQYILLSPNERKRLNILMLPKVTPTSTDLQIQSGGYNIVKFQGTHLRKLEAEKSIKISLLNNNIVVSQLLSWADEFSSLNLVNFQSIKTVQRIINATSKTQPSSTIDIDNLFAYFDAYFEKSMSVYRNVWFRGAVLIIKKFKMLKQHGTKLQSKQQWSLRGPVEVLQRNPQSEINFQSKFIANQSLQQYNFSTAIYHQNVSLEAFRPNKNFDFDALPKQKDELHEDKSLEDLVDIRTVPAYARFVQKMGGNLNLASNGYTNLDKQYKRELKYASGNLMHNQLRHIVDRSVKQFVDFFKSFPTLKQLTAANQIRPFRELKPLITKVKVPLKAATKEISKQLSAQQILKSKSSKNVVEEDLPEQLRIPDFLQLQDFVNPIIKVQLLLASDRVSCSPELQKLTSQLTFSKSQEQILREFETFFNQLVNSMNDVSRPEFCKIKVLTKKKYDREKEEKTEITEKQKKLNEQTQQSSAPKNQQYRGQQGVVTSAIRQGLFQEDLAALICPQILDYDAVMYSDVFKSKQAYASFFGRIQLVEVSDEIRTKDLYPESRQVDLQSKNVNTRVKVERTKQVCTTTEEVYRKQKKDLLYVVQQHLNELKQIEDIYEQFEDVIKGELKLRVQQFVSETTKASTKIEEFKGFVKEIHYYRRLVMQLPERAAFPLFEVGLLQVKKELAQRVENILFILLSAFEQDLLGQSTEIIGVFQGFAQVLAKNLVSAEDVVDMDSFKNNMVTEMAKLHQSLTTQKRCFFFLITHNDLPNIFCEPVEENGQLVSGQCYQYVQQTLEWPTKIQLLVSNAEDRHQAQRLMIENQVIATRKTFDKDIQELSVRIRKSNAFNDLKNYQRAYNQLKETKVTIEQTKVLSNQLETWEIQLFGSTQKSKQLLTACEMFDPTYLLWKTSYQLMTKINRWQGSPMDHISACEVSEAISGCRQNMDRVRKAKVGTSEQDVTLKVLAQLQREYEKILELFDLIKVLSSELLQDFHWQKIRQLVGSEQLNLKKLSLSAVVALDIKSIIPELNKILQQATALNRIENQLQEMQDGWAKRRLDTINLEETTNLIFEDEQLQQFGQILSSQIEQTDSLLKDEDSDQIRFKLSDWGKKLASLNKFIEEVTGLQRHYIEGFHAFGKLGLDFNSHEVQVFDLEAYNELDQLWHQTIARVQSDRFFIHMVLKQDLLDKLSSTLEKHKAKGQIASQIQN